jgi:hypothetical protein
MMPGEKRHLKPVIFPGDNRALIFEEGEGKINIKKESRHIAATTLHTKNMNTKTDANVQNELIHPKIFFKKIFFSEEYD